MFKFKKQKSKIKFNLKWEIPTIYTIKNRVKKVIIKILNLLFFPIFVLYKGISSLFNFVRNCYLVLVREVSQIVSVIARFVQDRIYNLGLRLKAIGVILRFIFSKPQDILFDQKQKEKFLLVSWQTKKNSPPRKIKKRVKKEKAKLGFGSLLGFKEISALIFFGLKKFANRLGNSMERTGLKLVHFSRRRNRKVEKSIATFIVFAFIAQALALTIFFALNVESQELCEVDVDVVLIMDNSGSMTEGETPSNCQWENLELVKNEFGETYICVSYSEQGLSQQDCQDKDDGVPPCDAPVYTPSIPSKIEAAKAAAKSFIDNLGNNDQSALVSFNSEAVLAKILSNNHSATEIAIDNLIPEGETNIGDAIDEGIKELTSERANPQANKVMILLTDGKANRPNGLGYGEEPADVAYALQKVQDMLDSGLNYKIFTIGLGSNSDINEEMLQNIADLTGAKYYHAPNGNGLSAIYDEIAWEVCQYGSISGCKYNDLNNNGEIDEDEKALSLSGWNIILSGEVETSQLTNENGCYAFTWLLPGIYTLSEELDSSKGIYYPTFPANGFYEIDLGQGKNVIEKDFANYFPVCGNEILDQYEDYSEECDDGNLEDGDGCSLICELEPFCGDGNLEITEECDDANNEDGDGCSAVCEIEPFCGDSNLDIGEECDDGNNNDGDGCSSVCVIEAEPEPDCGNGILNAAEECDQGQENGTVCNPEYDSTCNYCSKQCKIFTLTGSYCGDNILDSEYEECDDGNIEDGDGCSSICEIEEEAEPKPAPASSAGGGSVPVSPSLIIHQEQIEVVEAFRVKITWHTSIKSTSRVIYALEPGLFNPAEPPNYGYTFTTPEFDSPVNPFGVTYHEVWLTSLLPGTTYYFRTVSSASPEKISEEHSFTTLQSPVETGSLQIEPSGLSGLEDIEQELDEISYGIGVVQEGIIALGGTSLQAERPLVPGTLEIPEILEETPVFVEEETEEPIEQEIFVEEAVPEQGEPGLAELEQGELPKKGLLAGLGLIVERLDWWIWLIALLVLFIILRVLVASRKKKQKQNNNR